MAPGGAERIFAIGNILRLSCPVGKADLTIQTYHKMGKCENRAEPAVTVRVGIPSTSREGLQSMTSSIRLLNNFRYRGKAII